MKTKRYHLDYEHVDNYGPFFVLLTRIRLALRSGGQEEYSDDR